MLKETIQEMTKFVNEFNRGHYFLTPAECKDILTALGGQVQPPVSDDFGELKKIINTNTKICLGDHTMEDVNYMRNNRHKIAEWAETLDEINRWVKSQNSR